MKLDIQLSGSAAALVSLALNLGDPYSASAVHVIAAGKLGASWKRSCLVNVEMPWH